MKIQPVANQIIVRKIAEQVAVEFLKVDVPVGRAREGIVVSVGEGRRLENGELVPLDVKVGDWVVFSEEDARRIPENGESTSFSTSARSSATLGKNRSFP